MNPNWNFLIFGMKIYERASQPTFFLRRKGEDKRWLNFFQLFLSRQKRSAAVNEAAAWVANLSGLS
jgi:hypothetical protein